MPKGCPCLIGAAKQVFEIRKQDLFRTIFELLAAAPVLECVQYQIKEGSVSRAFRRMDEILNGCGQMPCLQVAGSIDSLSAFFDLFCQFPGLSESLSGKL